MEVPPPPPTPPAGLSRPTALLVTLLAILLALLLAHPTLSPLTRFTSRHHNRLHLSTTPPPPPTPEEATSTAHLLTRLTPAQHLSRARIHAQLAASPALRSRLLATLASLHLYRLRALSGVARKRKAYARLGREDRGLLARSGVDYGGKVAGVEGLVGGNARVVEAVLRHACAYYGVAGGEVRRFAGASAGGASGGGGAGEHSQLVQGLKHFVRDYSSEGEGERGRTFGLVKAWLREEYAGKSRDGVRVLVPGCGVGGLLWEVAGMGFEAVGVEWSFWMNALGHFVGSAPPEPEPEPAPLDGADGDGDGDEDDEEEGASGEVHKRKRKQHTIYPYIDWWSHHASTTNMTRPIRFPHSDPSSPLPLPLPLPLPHPHPTPPSSSSPAHHIHLHETDFTTLHPPFHPPPYSTLITLFFLDTAQSLPTYIRQIHAYLRPGGLWINLGPLLYGTKPWVELSLEEVLRVAEEVGFVFGDVVGGMRGAQGWKEARGGVVGGYDEWVDTLGDGTGRVVGVRAGYNVDWRGLGRNEYLAQGWVARKRG